LTKKKNQAISQRLEREKMPPKSRNPFMLDQCHQQRAALIALLDKRVEAGPSSSCFPVQLNQSSDVCVSFLGLASKSRFCHRSETYEAAGETSFVVAKLSTVVSQD